MQWKWQQEMGCLLTQIKSAHLKVLIFTRYSFTPSVSASLRDFFHRKKVSKVQVWSHQANKMYSLSVYPRRR